MNENEKHGKIPSTEEAWEARKLGADEAFVEKVSNEDIQEQIDRAAGTKLFSIRMEQQMIDALKYLASKNNGIGYQTLIKQILARFIEAEMKSMWNEAIAVHQRRKEEGNNNDEAA
ncbi:MAG: hypothetical protein AXA67_02105 [Methylothermaceae bacteria B42]|nr:MAG: hypothetical protein AXA67_02105 [Methylothermaceae bacteria B42]